MNKHELKPGDILLFPPVPFSIEEPLTALGHIITAITGGKVSHSAIYCGIVDQIPTVAHADLPGISSFPLQDLLNEEPACFVFRHNKYNSSCPIYKEALGYASANNPYPKLNLGLLGLLLLANRFAEETIKNKFFYDFTLWVSLKIMKVIEKHKHPGKTPMTCSQFAAQCYTDAGVMYDIHFHKLLIQFGALEKNDKVSTRSLLGIIQNKQTNSFRDNDIQEIIEIHNNESTIIANFLEFLRNKDGITMSERQTISEDDIEYAGQKLLRAISVAYNGFIPKTINEAIESLSTNRNYFVTPDDLYFNTTNLIDKGTLI